jgi:putative redox protein
MRTQALHFTAPDGHRLAARLDLPEGPVEAYALFAHCFTCSKDSLAASRIAHALTDAGFGVLRFDFTGLGDSEGEFAGSSFAGNVGELVAAAEALARQAQAPALLIGHSLGGAAALAAAARLPSVRAVATIGAPFDVQHVLRHISGDLDRLQAEGEAQVSIGGRPFKLRRGFLDDLPQHDQAARIGALRRALLVLHAPGDTVVGIDNASAIFQAARHPKSFVSLDDADHLLTDPADARYAADVIAAWASRYLAPARVLRRADDRGQVVVEETGEGQFQVRVTAGGATFLADEPVDVGGLGSGPTPYDLLCAGLGACTAMTVRMYARRKNLPLAHVRVGVGHLREAGAERPDRFMRELQLDGALTNEQRTRLLEIADRCPVHLTLERGARVATREVPADAALPAVEPAGQHVQDMAEETGAPAEGGARAAG